MSTVFVFLLFLFLTVLGVGSLLAEPKTKKVLKETDLREFAEEEEEIRVVIAAAIAQYRRVGKVLD